MTSPMIEHVRKELVRFLVSRTIFCPVTGELLDVRTCVVLNDPDGDPRYVLSQEGWRAVSADPARVEKLTELGVTVDESTVKA
jgi:hypothetical protein